jgi:hypothetical protein
MSAVLCGRRRGWQNVLAELLDLLDLAGQLVGERLLQRLQLAWSAHVLASREQMGHTWVLPVE